MKNRLQQAIRQSSPAEYLLYETLKDATVTIGPITLKIWPNLHQNLQEYSEAWLTLTSPQGRKYIKANLDNLLDYVETLIKGEQK